MSRLFRNNPNRTQRQGSEPMGGPEPDGRPRILDVLEPFIAVDAFATLAAIPGGFTIPAGQSALFGLVNATIGETLADNQVLQASAMTMLPCNPDGVAVNGEASPAAWGTDLGLGAAVVVGVDLPIKLGEWTGGSVYLPGVETAGDTRLNGESKYLDHWTFPTGKIGTAPVQKVTVPRNYAPNAFRLIEGDRLCVALVLRRATAIAAAGGNWSGLVDLRLQMGVRTAPRPFQ